MFMYCVIIFVSLEEYITKNVIKRLTCNVLEPLTCIVLERLTGNVLGKNSVLFCNV